MRESFKSSLFKQTCRGLLRRTESRSNMNMYSITITIIGLMFGMIQPSVSAVIATSTTAWSTQTSTTATTAWPTQTQTASATPSTRWPTQTSTASPTSSTMWPTQTPTGSTTSTSSPLPVTTTYSNSLQATNPLFVRPGSNPGNYYYYQAIQVTTYTNGAYTFKSSSSMDTYGCLYDTSFDPYNPSQNLIRCDDDSAGSYQFLINSTLQYGRTYILVVTTYSPGVIGAYWVIATGPATVYMTTITPSTYPTTTTTSTSPSPVTTTYSNSLQLTNPTFVRPYDTSGMNYYYQAIQVTTYTSGAYTFKSSSLIDTYGCFYQGSFDPSRPSQNLIVCDDDSAGDGQFLINASLFSSVTYILVVTTYRPMVTGAYSVIATGPATVYMTTITPSTYPTTTTTSTSPYPVTTTYSNSLQLTNPTFVRPYDTSGMNYYYQAIQVTTYTSGAYTFKSSSLIDTYGCFYQGSFDPSRPSQNLIVCDNDSAGDGQFLINASLFSSVTYILVVTTYRPMVTGAYSVIATGPATVYMTTITPSTYPTTPSRPTSPYPVTTTYSNSLQATNPAFVRPNGTSSMNYYYQAIQVTTYTNGAYTFKSSSTIDTYGCFYDTSFDPSRPSQNLIVCDDDSGGDRQFLFSANLYYGHTYVLVVTTYSPGVTGAYSVIATGPATVYMNSITPPTSTFSGTLSSNSPTFSRPNGFGSHYYYQAIQFTIYTSGTYTLRSNSVMDTYGILYTTSFDPSDPWHNLLTYDDDTGGSSQFLISRYLQSGTTFVLVVTTSSSYTTGSYSVIATGPQSIYMTVYTPPSRLNVIEIIAITFGCLMVFVIILGVCIRRRQRQIVANQRRLSPTSNVNPLTQNVYLPGPQRNRPQENAYARSNISPTYVAPVVVTEDFPPSYDTFMATAKPYQQQ